MHRLFIVFFTLFASIGLSGCGYNTLQAQDAVSYTHLTLPTIYSV